VHALDVFRSYIPQALEHFPTLVYSKLYRRVRMNLHLEFQIERENLLFSPLYVPLRGEAPTELLEMLLSGETFFDSLKDYLVASLFVYSSLVDENAYYLLDPQSVVVARLIHNREHRFEVKYYSHYADELVAHYEDKIYIGRDFVNLARFERKYLGLKKYFLSLVEQNDKVQERARHKLNYYEEYREGYLNEIHEMTQETFRDAMERVKMFRETRILDIPRNRANEVLNEIFHMLQLMEELRDFAQEFENKLRQRGETQFVKYLTKYSKDVVDGIRYLKKLTAHLHLKISGWQI